MFYLCYISYCDLGFIDFLLIDEHAQVSLQLAYLSSEPCNGQVSFLDASVFVEIAENS